MKRNLRDESPRLQCCLSGVAGTYPLIICRHYGDMEENPREPFISSELGYTLVRDAAVLRRLHEFLQK